MAEGIIRIRLRSRSLLRRVSQSAPEAERKEYQEMKVVYNWQVALPHFESARGQGVLCRLTRLFVLGLLPG